MGTARAAMEEDAARWLEAHGGGAIVVAQLYDQRIDLVEDVADPDDIGAPWRADIDRVGFEPRGRELRGHGVLPWLARWGGTGARATDGLVGRVGGRRGLIGYTLCERKKRPADALAYNGLIQSWPEITRLAQERGKPTAVQGGMFDDTGA